MLHLVGESKATTNSTVRMLWIGQGAQSISLKLWGEMASTKIPDTNSQAVVDILEITAEVEGIDYEDENPSILIENKVYQCPHALLDLFFPGGNYVPKTSRSS
ncbi:hypothetical protein ScPMuIL_014713 [Solemya velum]